MLVARRTSCGGRGQRRAAAGGCGHCRDSRTTSSPSSCLRSSCTGPHRCRRWPRPCSTSPRTTSTGTARWTPTCATRAGCTSTPRSRASTTSRTRGPSSSYVTPTSKRVAAPSDSPSVRHRSACSASSTACSSTGRSSPSARPPQQSWAPSPTCVPQAPHNVANALAAAALARAYGVPPAAVRDGLRAFRPGHHRIEQVGDVDGVTYVDDSKATNPHAASASLACVRLGGLGRRRPGQGCDVRGPRAGGADTACAASFCWAQDRAVIADALARHAPEVPVVEVASTDTDVMEEVVLRAAGLAQPGDTVLLAPAAASMDLFRDYAHRGDAFAEAVALARGRSRPVTQTVRPRPVVLGETELPGGLSGRIAVGARQAAGVLPADPRQHARCCWDSASSWCSRPAR